MSAASSEDVSGGVTGKEAHGDLGARGGRRSLGLRVLRLSGPREAVGVCHGCDEPLSLSVTGRAAEGSSREPWVLRHGDQFPALD